MPRSTRMVFSLLVGLALIVSAGRAREQGPALAAARAGARTIEFETREVTQADVTVSPDDQWLIFTILGHLFRLPVAGGRAEQLTFGPYYDSDPEFSPDGTRVVFVSDREDSERNVFLLDLATGQITQVTREPWADRPTWAPDGQRIVYLSLVGEPRTPSPSASALVRQVRLGGAEPETISSPRRLVTSVFYLPDQRLAWSVIENPETGSSRGTSRIEVLSAAGVVSTLGTFETFADRVVASPAADGFYCRCYGWPDSPADKMTQRLLLLPLMGGVARDAASVVQHEWLNFIWMPRQPFRFALTSHSKNLYLGDTGRLWKIEPASRFREAVPFVARVRLEIQDPVVPRKPSFPAPGSAAPPRVIEEPRLFRDGRRLVFGAAGYLWEQPLGGGPTRRLFQGNAVEWGPVFSPDGRQLAFISTANDREEIRVLNVQDRQVRTLVTFPEERIDSDLNWSPDGQRLVFLVGDDPPYAVMALAVKDGAQEKLTDAAEDWSDPQFSVDGRSLYVPDSAGALLRLRLGEKSPPERVTQLERPVIDGRISPDGKWLAFLGRNPDAIWVAPLGNEPVKEQDIRRLGTEGGRGHAFTLDSSALVYAVGNRVWRQPVAGGPPEEVPIRFELQHPTPPPILVRRVRVLDYAVGGFSQERSLFIEQGRIRWIGSERGRNIPRDTAIVDAGGRFAIPGLFDMHVHTGWNGTSEQEAFVGYGVTSVRDVGSPLPKLIRLADRSESDSVALPRSFYSGAMFEGSHAGAAAIAIRDEAEARVAVRRWKEAGAQFIKVHPPISWRLQLAVTDEARRLGLPVVAHGVTVEDLTKGVTLGYASLEHDQGRPYDDVLQMLVAAGTRWDPTMEIDANAGTELMIRSQPERLADPRLRALIPERFLESRAPVRAGAEGGRFASTELLRVLMVEMQAGIQPADRRGVKLLAGTDTFWAESRPFSGLSLHWELEYFVQAGLSPIEVLRMATERAAEALGAQDDLGTLEAGKLADIVLLDKNPLDAIKNTQTIWRVLKGGWLFDPDKLPAPVAVGAPR